MHRHETPARYTEYFTGGFHFTFDRQEMRLSAYVDGTGFPLVYEVGQDDWRKMARRIARIAALSQYKPQEV